jgi:hypothetical protein
MYVRLFGSWQYFKHYECQRYNNDSEECHHSKPDAHGCYAGHWLQSASRHVANGHQLFFGAEGQAACFAEIDTLSFVRIHHCKLEITGGCSEVAE